MYLTEYWNDDDDDDEIPMPQNLNDPFRIQDINLENEPTILDNSA